MADSLESKMRSSDRELVLSIIPGKEARGATGLVDTNLFTGTNKLHAKMDPQSTFWYFQYEKGILPEPLKQKFTSFKILMKHADEYFKKRNIEIKEVKD
jgi:hypothetical protein